MSFLSKLISSSMQVQLKSTMGCFGWTWIYLTQLLFSRSNNTKLRHSGVSPAPASSHLHRGTRYYWFLCILLKMFLHIKAKLQGLYFFYIFYTSSCILYPMLCSLLFFPYQCMHAIPKKLSNDFQVPSSLGTLNAQEYPRKWWKGRIMKGNCPIRYQNTVSIYSNRNKMALEKKWANRSIVQSREFQEIYSGI